MDAGEGMTSQGQPGVSLGRSVSDLPRLLLIADGFVGGRAGLSAAAVRERVVRLVAAGVQAVQLRDHRADAGAFAATAASLTERLRAEQPDLVVLCNGHPDVALALSAVLHVGHRGISVEEARRKIGEDVLLSFSAHSPSDARRAVRDGADILLVSPLFPTPSHPGQPPGEIQLLERTRDALADVSPFPALYALGGILPERVDACLRAGAHGVAVLSGLLEALDPEAAARAYLGTLD